MTDQGKVIVNEYQSDTDAHKVYAKLSDHGLKPTKDLLHLYNFVTYIVSAHVEYESCCGTIEIFIINCQ